MLLMMSNNIARNMYSTQGTINYPTQLRLVCHFRNYMYNNYMYNNYMYNNYMYNNYMYKIFQWLFACH